jgi:hypothetical protein
MGYGDHHGVEFDLHGEESVRMPKAMNPSRFVGWLYDLGGQQVDVELLSGKICRGELSIYDEDTDHVRLKNEGTVEGIPLAAIARVRAVPK